jgi:hypothetical protein
LMVITRTPSASSVRTASVMDPPGWAMAQGHDMAAAVIRARSE